MIDIIIRTLFMAATKLKESITRRISAKGHAAVWTPADFLDLGSRDAVDKTLQRLVGHGELRRIDRGLYDKPVMNNLTKKPTAPDYREIIRGISRRDQSRMLIDGMTAANELGLTDAVPARVVVHTDARHRSFFLDQLKIEFKLTAPSKLYWADRPAMRIVQGLHWLKDTLPGDQDRIMKRLHSILHDPESGTAMREDLQSGLHTLPAWMQGIVGDLLSRGEKSQEPAE